MAKAEGPVSGQVSILRLLSGSPEPAERAQHNEAQGSGDSANAVAGSCLFQSHESPETVATRKSHDIGQAVVGALL